MTTDVGKVRARDIGSGRVPASTVAAAATASNPPAGGSGIQAGCYDTSGNRDLMIASLTDAIADMATLRAELVALGVVAGSVTDAGKTRARDLGSGKTPVRAVSATATAGDPPAGGTGQTAGGYDTDTNRNSMITSLTALIADVDSMRTELKAMSVIDGGPTIAGKARARDIGSGRTPVLAVSIAATASNPPSSGSGANAGGYSSAANRDLMIVSLTAVIADIAALRVELVAMNVVAA